MRTFIAFLAGALLLGQPALAVTTTNQLVYSFSYGSEQNITARDAADSAETINTATNQINGSGGTNGMSHYQGRLSDKGTMTVQIVREQSDGGLIVSISEQGETTRRAPPADCVVYGNTSVICDPNKTVYPEEYTLLRFLGRNFVDPSQLDAARHWTISQPSGAQSVKADYTINANNGGLMQIGEHREIGPASGKGNSTDVQTKIGYDFSRGVPTSVDEYVTQRQDSGIGGTSTTIYQTVLTLASSTVAKP